jgi:hypothetical protein
VHWTDNNWETFKDTDTKDTTLGIYVADIVSDNLKRTNIIFTFFWKKEKCWENNDFEVKIENG